MVAIARTILPPDQCPWCGYMIDAASCLEGDVTPSPNDLSLCMSCGSVLQFGPDLRLGKITDQAVRDMLSAEEYAALKRARRLLLEMDRKEVGVHQRRGL